MATDDLGRQAHPFRGGESDYRPLLDLVGDSSLVLLGEGSHGTHDFYYERAEITKRLITEKGFSAVAVEADWPDAYRVNRYAQGDGEDGDANAALSGFQRFPTWMWRNTVVLDFVEWLRDINSRPRNARTGFFGMDLYSLFNSMEAVVEYLERVDPEAAKRGDTATPASSTSVRTARRTDTSPASTSRAPVRTEPSNSSWRSRRERWST
jgi:erythromycin esterase-like protein